MITLKKQNGTCKPEIEIPYIPGTAAPGYLLMKMMKISSSG